MDPLLCRALAESRREKRFLSNCPAMLTWDGVTQPVHIRNISTYGALLIGLTPPPVGERVILIAEWLEVCATVIWYDADRCGVLFNRPVDPLALASGPAVRTVSWSDDDRLNPQR